MRKLRVYLAIFILCGLLYPAMPMIIDVPGNVGSDLQSIVSLDGEISIAWTKSVPGTTTVYYQKTKDLEFTIDPVYISASCSFYSMPGYFGTLIQADGIEMYGINRSGVLMNYYDYYSAPTSYLPGPVYTQNRSEDTLKLLKYGYNNNDKGIYSCSSNFTVNNSPIGGFTDTGKLVYITFSGDDAPYYEWIEVDGRTYVFNSYGWNIFPTIDEDTDNKYYPAVYDKTIYMLNFNDTLTSQALYTAPYSIKNFSCSPVKNNKLFFSWQDSNQNAYCSFFTGSTLTDINTFHYDNNFNLTANYFGDILFSSFNNTGIFLKYKFYDSQNWQEKTIDFLKEIPDYSSTTYKRMINLNKVGGISVLLYKNDFSRIDFWYAKTRYDNIQYYHYTPSTGGTIQSVSFFPDGDFCMLIKSGTSKFFYTNKESPYSPVSLKTKDSWDLYY